MGKIYCILFTVTDVDIDDSSPASDTDIDIDKSFPEEKFRFPKI